MRFKVGKFRRGRGKVFWKDIEEVGVFCRVIFRFYGFRDVGEYCFKVFCKNGREVKF